MSDFLQGESESFTWDAHGLWLMNSRLKNGDRLKASIRAVRWQYGEAVPSPDAHQSLYLQVVFYNPNDPDDGIRLTRHVNGTVSEAVQLIRGLTEKFEGFYQLDSRT